MKKAAQIVIAVVVVYGLTCSVFFALMLQPPDRFAAAMRHVPWPAWAMLPLKHLWLTARSGQLHTGDPAPDFLLETTDHQSHFQLSSLRGQKPVVLVFGSYT